MKEFSEKEDMPQNIECGTDVYAIQPDDKLKTLKDISDEMSYYGWKQNTSEERYEFQKNCGMLKKDNIIAHSVYNLSEECPIEMQFENLIVPEESVTSLYEISKMQSVFHIDEDGKKQYMAVHDAKQLISRFENGEKEISLEFRSKLRDGKVRWVQDILHMIRNPKDNNILLFEYYYDINKIKSLNIMMEFAVNDEYDLLGSVNFEDNGAVMLYGKESYNIYNQSLIEEDYTKSLIRFAYNAIVPEEREEYLKNANIENIKRKLEKHPAYEFYFHMRKNGSVKIKKVRYIIYGNNPNICLFIQNDLTEIMREEKKKQKKLAEALESAKTANHSKSTFLSQMSHEIRTPMNAIMGMAQLAKDSGDLKEKDTYIEKIQSASMFLLGIINDILDMSQIESGKFELHPSWVRREEVFEACMDMLIPAMEKKKIHFVYPKQIFEKLNDIEYYLDSLRVQQIYMNLLNNAMKFTPEGGEISLSIKNLSHDGAMAVDQVTISDTGCGMSKEFLTRIFKPFEQEHNTYSHQVEGTGLGLALVKQILTSMGGEISVKSKLNKGSTFTFTLPYQYRKAEKVRKKLFHKIDLANKRVLLADDHPLNREIAVKLLEKKEMIVEVARDGKEALDKFESSKIGYYDIILMDIRMPILDGLMATKKIRALERKDAKKVLIIAMTANAFNDDVKRSFDAGMNDHLTKPIEPERLYRTIAKWL